MMLNKYYTIAFSASSLLFTLGSTALAQDGLIGQADASTGSTDVAAEGFQATAEDTGEMDATEAKISAGGLLATGNSQSIAVTAAANLRLRRQANQYSADAAVNYARSAAETDAPMETTVKNFQARIRYDRFLSERWALFVSDSFRNDKFQGLSVRNNLDPGVAFYVLAMPTQRLWFEAGYDMQYDVRTRDAIADALAGGTIVERTETRHAARLFGGYTNTLNEHVAFNTGLEYLQAFAETRNWRMNWELGLTASLSDKFSLSATFNLRYDNNPLPEIAKLDTATAMSLVYALK